MKDATTGDQFPCNKNKRNCSGIQTHPYTLHASALSSVTLSSDWLSPWSLTQNKSQAEKPQAGLVYRTLTSKKEWAILAGTSQQGGHRASIELAYKKWLSAHQAQVCHGETPIWSHREAAWDPHRCTHDRLGSQILWPSSGFHIVVSERQRTHKRWLINICKFTFVLTVLGSLFCRSTHKLNFLYCLERKF